MLTWLFARQLSWAISMPFIFSLHERLSYSQCSIFNTIVKTQDQQSTIGSAHHLVPSRAFLISASVLYAHVVWSHPCGGGLAEEVNRSGTGLVTSHNPNSLRARRTRREETQNNSFSVRKRVFCARSRAQTQPRAAAV